MKKLSKTEELVFREVLDAGELTINQLTSRMESRHKRTYARNTIVTFLKRMEEKGYVQRNRIGREAYVTPLISRHEYMAMITGDMIDYWFGGNPGQYISFIQHNF